MGPKELINMISINVCYTPYIVGQQMTSSHNPLYPSLTSSHILAHNSEVNTSNSKLCKFSSSISFDIQANPKSLLHISFIHRHHTPFKAMN